MTDSQGVQGVQGDLGLFSIFEVTQSLMMGRKTGQVTVKNGEREGSVFFADGQIIHARDDQMRTGEAAAYEVLSWRQGQFRIDFEVPVPDRTITVDTENLMLEVARIVDEGKAEAGIDDASAEVEEEVAQESLETRFRTELNKVFKQVANDRGATRSKYSVRAFDELLVALTDLDGTALYLRAGAKPRIKTSRGFQTIRQETIAPGEIESFLSGMLSAIEQQGFDRDREIGFDYTSDQGSRFSISAFDDGGCAALIFSPASRLIPRLEDLGGDGPQVAQLLDRKTGLLMVNGPFSSGKSTFIAALLEEVLLERDQVATLFAKNCAFDFPEDAGFLIRSDLSRFSLGVTGSLHRAIELGSDLVVVDRIQSSQMFLDALAVASRSSLVIAVVESDGTKEFAETIGEYAREIQGDKVARQFSSSLLGIVDIDLNDTVSAERRTLALWQPDTSDRQRLAKGDFRVLERQLVG